MYLWLALPLVTIVAFLAGAIASVAGFGIGSLLTPLLAVQTGTKLAVAAISIPHAAGTALRFWRLRHHINPKVLWGFGLTSAAGGLAGALLHTIAGGPVLTALLGILLVFAGILGLTGYAQRMRFAGQVAWVAGALSGLFGGLVGNQGGVRSAALFGFDLPKQSFVATATAIALMVDAARMPVYLATQGSDIARAWPYLLVATLGVLLGTLVGERILHRVPELLFRRVVAVIILILGVALLVATGRQLLV